MSLGLSGQVKDEEKKTGYTYKKQEIVLTKQLGRPLSGIRKQPGYYDDKKRTEVATLFAATGNMKSCAELTGVPYATVIKWRKEEWFKEILDEVRNENNDIIDQKFTELITGTLDKLGDRIENGDYQVLRDGTLIRVPVKARDLTLVTAINIDKRQLLRGLPTTRSEQVKTELPSIEDLAKKFIELASKGKPRVQIEDGTVIEAEVVKEPVTPSE